MNPFLILKNMYLAIFFHLLCQEKVEGAKRPFSIIVWETRVFWTILLPIFIPLIVLKAIKRILSNKDIEDSLNESKKLLAIYSELSEFEWRYPVMILLRMCKKASRGLESGAVINVPSLDDLYGALLMSIDILCQARQETREEYITRCSHRLLEDQRKSEEERLLYKEKYEASINETIGKQFDLIVKNGKGNTFKEFYLGREFLFLKKSIGKPKKFNPTEMNSAESH